MQNLTIEQIDLLRRMGNHPFTMCELQTLFRTQDVIRKARSLVSGGLLVRLKRDLFIVSEKLSGVAADRFLIANRICTPSYVSREAALSYYGMIPEMVVNMTSSRLGRTTSFDTPLGDFQYVQVDRETYPIGLREVKTETGTCLCASPEKALYDLLLSRHNLNIRGKGDLKDFLYEDLRFDGAGVPFSRSVFDELILHGRKRKLVEMLKNEVCRESI